MPGPRRTHGAMIAEALAPSKRVPGITRLVWPAAAQLIGSRNVAFMDAMVTTDEGTATALLTTPRRVRSWHSVLLAAVLVVSAGATLLATRQTSATFDEILLPSAGARGYATGNHDLVMYYHPRIMPYLYGIPVHLSGVRHPADEGQWVGRVAFPYARLLYLEGGVPAERLVFRTRLVAVGIAMLLVLLVHGWVRRHYGATTALLAASMTAFLPDLLAHGGIAYNDIPNAAAVLAAVWGLDRAARRPDARTALVAGVLTGIALNVKYSAIALAPVAVVLVLLEAVSRRGELRPYAFRAAGGAVVILGTVYLLTVLVHLGDFTLASFRAGLAFNINHASGGHGGIPAWLMGRASPEGFRWYFPAAFIIKTPAAFHALILLALVGLVNAWRRRPDALRRAVAAPLRAPVVAFVVYGVFLLSAGLNIGFRHAHTLLPFLAIITAAGLWQLWRDGSRALRTGIVALVALQAVSTLSWYPHFIPYISEYFGDRDRGHMLLTDSNHDWGQGLVALRRFMEEEQVDVVHLSYFGSMDPEAYGVRYAPLRSFFPLPPTTPPANEPRYIAISATNLIGTYVEDVFAPFRDVEPYRVLGHTIFIYRLAD
jgi:hypothetical protein